ncbi:MAG: hypothetical protein ACK47M_05290 [Caldilinea sp.]
MTHYLLTDEYEEAVSALEMVTESLEKARVDPYRWKWALIALHSAVQGFMVLALRGSNNLAILKKNNAIEWIEALRNNRLLTDERLDTYLNLYSKVKKATFMQKYIHSIAFVPSGSQDHSIRMLNSLRNEFIHFVPKGWRLEVSELPALVIDCLNFIIFLGWQCGNVLWYEPSMEFRAKAAVASAQTIATELSMLYHDC